MAGPIAFCTNPSCGSVFQFDNFIGGNANANITLINTSVGPYPACGGMGKIPDGNYEYANGIMRILTSSKINLLELQKIEKILRFARTKKESNRETIIDKVKAASPVVAGALDSVPSQENVLQWIAILIALIALAIQIHSTYIKETPKNINEKVIEYLIKEFGPKPKEIPKEKGTYKREGRKIQRNELCPCGSGKKYKKCCGNPLTTV